MNLRSIPKRIAVDCVRTAPLGLFGNAVGWGARQTLPRALRAPLYSAYAAWFGAELSEAELPLAEYPSLGSFFARRLRDGARPPVVSDTRSLVAPCDGELRAFGAITGGVLVQAKGIDYSLTELLQDEELADEFTSGFYATVYLSPKDYHRVHSPVSGHVTGFRYVPGLRLPVNALFRDGYDGLFVKNERVVIHLQTSSGPCAVVMVGATAVGHIRLTYGHAMTDSLARGREPIEIRHDPVEIAAGAEIGAFHLGSTVVMLVPAGGAIRADLHEGRVLVGTDWGRLAQPQSTGRSANGRARGMA